LLVPGIYDTLAIAVALQRTKPPQTSPTFEKLNLERLSESRDVNDSAKKTVEQSRKIIDQSKELIHLLRTPKSKNADL
jgi:hypothetical protein